MDQARAELEREQLFTQAIGATRAANSRLDEAREQMNAAPLGSGSRTSPPLRR
jgi:hypothetical protein